MRLFFNKTITVARLTNDNGTDRKEAYASNGTIQGSVMNANPAESMLSEGNPSNSAVLFCEASADLKATDKITVDSVDYIVRGVNVADGIGFTISYKKAIIEKLKS